MLKRTCLIFLYVAVATSVATETQAQWMDVTIVQGPVRGHRDPKDDLFAFYEIPYATAPTGDQKYKAPLPAPVWTERLDAVEKGVKCPQLFFKFGEQEQCLVANVFVPDTTIRNLPVLVYIHGGSFQGGYGNWLPVRQLMRKDMIVVNFNYRLGIHGFLCLGTEDASGNAGLKDMVALLRWVQQNIAAFGGNPNDVTLAGYSAGSASVDLLMIMKATDGLFHKVIQESGSNLSTFALQMNPVENAKDFAKELNFTNVDDIDALEKFYKGLSYEALTSTALDNTDNTAHFSLCVERETNDSPILTQSPLSILKSGDYKKLPMLYGFANMEGLVRAGNFDAWKDHMNEKFSDYISGDLKFDSEAEKEKIAEQVKQKYFGDRRIDNDNILGFIDMQTDSLFAYGTLRAAKYYVEGGNNQVYLYQYSFVDENTPVVPHTDVRGAEHCAQTIAVSDGQSFIITNEEGITERFKVMKSIIRDYWRNFILTGIPVADGSSLPAWPAANANRSPYMSLAENVTLGGALLEDRALFWDEIYAKYAREPLPPRSHAVRLDHAFVLSLLCLSILLTPMTNPFTS